VLLVVLVVVVSTNLGWRLLYDNTVAH